MLFYATLPYHILSCLGHMYMVLGNQFGHLGAPVDWRVGLARALLWREWAHSRAACQGDEGVWG